MSRSTASVPGTWVDRATTPAVAGPSSTPGADRHRPAEGVPDERDALDAAPREQVLDEQDVEQAILEVAGLAVVDAHAAQSSADRVVQAVRRARESTERAAQKQRGRILAGVEPVAKTHDDAVGGDHLHDGDVRCHTRLGDGERSQWGDAGSGAFTNGIGEGVQAVSLSRRRTCTQDRGS